MESPSVEKKCISLRENQNKTHSQVKRKQPKDQPTHISQLSFVSPISKPRPFHQEKKLRFTVFCEATKWSTSSVTDTLDGRPGDAVQLSLKLRALAPMKIVALKDAISINLGRLGLFSDTNYLLVSGRTETQEMQIGSCSNAVPIVASNNFEFWGDLVLSHCTLFALWRLYFLFESRGIPTFSQSQPMVWKIITDDHLLGGQKKTVGQKNW